MLAAFRRGLQRRQLERIPGCMADPVSLEMIDTEVGNRILDSLKAEGWKQVAQYSPLAFDKGIDYDSYRLRRGPVELRLEWDNWQEWTISGPRTTLGELARRFSLKSEFDEAPGQMTQGSSPR